MKTDWYEEHRLAGLEQALTRLRKKSRSFYIASGVFPARIRIDLILLYSFCRVADDLIDEETSTPAARKTIKKLRAYLDLAYSDEVTEDQIYGHIVDSFPKSTHAALILLPTRYLPSRPLYSLLDGFETDLNFGEKSFPMRSDEDLLNYAAQVAGTVAWLCIVVVLRQSSSGSRHVGHGFEHPTFIDTSEDSYSSPVMKAGEQMGIALQLINIARDIQTDALLGRVYIPTSRLKEHGLTPQDIIRAYKGEFSNTDMSFKIETIRKEMLDWAMGIYRVAKQEIERIPKDARGGFRVMVESYVEIGRVMLREDRRGTQWGRNGKATVSKWRRIWVARRAMIGR